MPARVHPADVAILAILLVAAVFMLSRSLGRLARWSSTRTTVRGEPEVDHLEATLDGALETAQA